MFAPSHTVGGEAVLPAGTIIIASDQVPWAEGFGAYPEDYDELEDVLVPEALRSKEMYAGGYSLTFLAADIGDLLEQIAPLDPRPSRVPRLRRLGGPEWDDE